MSSKPGRVELGVRGTSVLLGVSGTSVLRRTWTKNIYADEG